MSDRELIITFLEKAEKRARSNRRFNEIAATLAIAFVVPVVFKLLDLVFLFRGRTVVLFLGLWGLATAVWIIIRLRGKSPLAQVAGSIDKSERLNDQLKTAFWFIQNPRASDWVDVQIHRAAQTSARLRISKIFPRRVPRASYMVGALLFLLVALNFLPLSLNYNWVYLHAAPPFRLNDEARANLESALALLERAKAAENAEIVSKLESLISDLEQGNISLSDAIRQLEELQQELEAGDLDAENMTNGLGQMASILRQAKALREAALPMGQGKLPEAAAQMRNVADSLAGISPADVREMSEKLISASEKPRSGLQDLASAFAAAGAALQRGDRTAARSGFERVSKELESLGERLADQALRSEAGDEIGDLVDALEISEEEAGDSGEPKAGQAGNQGKAPNAWEKGEPSETAAEGGVPEEFAQEGEGGEGGEPGEEGQAGDNPGETSSDMANGKGGNSFGGSTKSAPLEGEATALEVQLQKEALKIEDGEGSQEPEQDIEVAGERERSKLDYRNAPSNLTPAEKDLLGQDRIPWESRQLIKNYFQAVKPAQNK